MKEEQKRQKGFTLIEVLIASSLGAALCLGIFWFGDVVSKNTQKLASRAIAQKLMDTLASDLRIQFKRRDWDSGIYGGAELFELEAPPAFGNTVSPTGFQCPAGQTPTPCQNLRIFQISATKPVDTFRKVEFKTNCQEAAQAPPIPEGLNSKDFQTEEGECKTPPEVTQLKASHPDGAIQETQKYQGNKIIGTSLCFRGCTGGGIDAGGKHFGVELAVVYQGANNSWELLKGHTTLSTSDTAEDIQVIPNSEPP